MSLPSTPLAGAMARRGAVAPVMLLDVLSRQGYSYHWASMPIASAAALGCSPVYTGMAPPWNAQLRIGSWDDVYLPWLLTSGPFHLTRSLQADVGNFTIQNVSGSTVQRDMSTLITGDAFESALFAYREWNLDAREAEFEMHGRLTIVAVSETIAEFAAEQLFNPSDYQACLLMSETCPWRYASAACGDTTNNPCENSWLTCRQPSRYGGIVQALVNVQPPGTANTSTRQVVRNRQL
jgi:hypothetical protein